MRRIQKKMVKRKLFCTIILLVFLFSIIKVGIAFAATDTFTITSCEISNKSDTTDVSDFCYENCKIISNVIFHKLGDSITYKIKVKNNENMTYTIKYISDDNENEYITYVYDGYEGTKLNSREETTFEITEKYVYKNDDVTKRNQNPSVNIIFSLEDEDGNSTDMSIPINKSGKPKTGDNVGVYITTSVASLILLILLSRKNTISVNNSKLKQVNSKSRAMKNTIEGNRLNSVSRANKSSRKHKGKHYSKHSGKMFKLFSLFFIGALVLPTISKAVTDYVLTITFENNVFLKDKLIISYSIKDDVSEIVVGYNERVDELEEPVIEGYTFEGWELEDGTEFDENTLITDDVEIIAKLTPITYTISYDLKYGILEAGKINPIEYTVENEAIELNKPIKEGYDFAGWTGTDLTGIVEIVTIEKGSIGNRAYTANWTPTDYRVTYNLNGGIANGNPDTYTIETNNIELNKPTKEGYDFAGWSGTELTGTVENVTIEKGSKGNREYVANWTPINYTITYVGLAEEEKSNLNNPTTYNIETPEVTLNNPQDRKDEDNDLTERFVGWREDESISTEIVIPNGLGNKTYEAIWVAVEPNTYIVTYNLNGGSVETENRTSFTKFDTFTLNNPSKRGYTFAGWTGSNGPSPQTRVTVPTGIRENLNYEANWNEDRYTITYNLNGGTAENPEEYTVNSNDILLNRPTKTGYTFTGWTGTDLSEKTLDVTINKSSIGNRSYTANWQANTYTIIYDKNSGSGSMANQEMRYDVKSDLDKNVYTKAGHTFAGWNTKSDGTGEQYSDEEEVENITTDGEIRLYAQWEINSYEVTFKDGITIYETQSVRYNEKVTRPENPTKDDATFVGWYLNNSIYDFNTSVTDNIELIARYYRAPSISLNLNSKYSKGSNVNISATYTVDEYAGLKKIEYYYYKNGTYTSISNINALNIGSYTIYAKVTDNNDNSATASAEVQIFSKLYDVASVGDYVEYIPTSTSYTSNIYDGNTGTIYPSNTTSWRVLAKNSDGTIDIIPDGIAGTFSYGGNVHKTAGTANDYDNIVWVEYEDSLQRSSNVFINSTYAESARAVTESDFSVIKSKGLGISSTYAVNKKDYESRSWTGDHEGGANWYYYIYYAEGSTIKQFTIWDKYAGTGGQSSNAHSINLGVRPIIRLKAGVLQNSGNGTSGNKWKLTTE